MNLPPSLTSRYDFNEYSDMYDEDTAYILFDLIHTRSTLNHKPHLQEYTTPLITHKGLRAFHTHNVDCLLPEVMEFSTHGTLTVTNELGEPEVMVTLLTHPTDSNTLNVLALEVLGEYGQGLGRRTVEIIQQLFPGKDLAGGYLNQDACEFWASLGATRPDGTPLHYIPNQKEFILRTRISIEPAPISWS